MTSDVLQLIGGGMLGTALGLAVFRRPRKGKGHVAVTLTLVAGACHMFEPCEAHASSVGAETRVPILLPAESYIHDAGPASLGAKVVGTFVFENSGADSVALWVDKGSCSCLSVELDGKAEICPGESRRLKMTIRATHKQDGIIGGVVVRLGKNPRSIRLGVRATVKGDTTVEPRTLNFGDIMSDRASRRTVRITHVGPESDAFRITNVVPKAKWLAVEKVGPVGRTKLPSGEVKFVQEVHLAARSAKDFRGDVKTLVVISTMSEGQELGFDVFAVAAFSERIRAIPRGIVIVNRTNAKSVHCAVTLESTGGDVIAVKSVKGEGIELSSYWIVNGPKKDQTELHLDLPVGEGVEVARGTCLVSFSEPPGEQLRLPVRIVSLRSPSPATTVSGPTTGTQPTRKVSER